MQLECGRRACRCRSRVPVGHPRPARPACSSHPRSSARTPAASLRSRQPRQPSRPGVIGAKTGNYEARCGYLIYKLAAPRKGFIWPPFFQYVLHQSNLRPRGLKLALDGTRSSGIPFLPPTSKKICAPFLTRKRARADLPGDGIAERHSDDNNNAAARASARLQAHRRRH